MTARDKAAAGFWMLKQAVFDLLSQRGGMQPSEVEDALNIPRLGFELLAGMAERGEVEKGDGHHPKYFLPGSQRQVSRHRAGSSSVGRL
jgi:hypothetical protein